MTKSTIKGNKIINLIEQGELISSVKSKTASTPDEWYRFSSKAYNIYLDKVKKDHDKGGQAIRFQGDPKRH